MGGRPAMDEARQTSSSVVGRDRQHHSVPDTPGHLDLGGPTLDPRRPLREVVDPGREPWTVLVERPLHALKVLAHGGLHERGHVGAERGENLCDLARGLSGSIGMVSHDHHGSRELHDLRRDQQPGIGRASLSRSAGCCSGPGVFEARAEIRQEALGEIDPERNGQRATEVSALLHGLHGASQQREIHASELRRHHRDGYVLTEKPASLLYGRHARCEGDHPKHDQMAGDIP
jgi:hypothetical protein